MGCLVTQMIRYWLQIYNTANLLKVTGREDKKYAKFSISVPKVDSIEMVYAFKILCKFWLKLPSNISGSQGFLMK